MTLKKNILGLLEQRDCGWFFLLCLLLSSTTKIKTIMPRFNPNLNLGITDVCVPRHRWNGFKGRSWAWRCDASVGSAGGLEDHTCRSRERAFNAFILFYFTMSCEDTFSPWWYIYLAILWLWGIHKQKIKRWDVPPTEHCLEIKNRVVECCLSTSLMCAPLSVL